MTPEAFFERLRAAGIVKAAITLDSDRGAVLELRDAKDEGILIDNRDLENAGF